MRAKKYGPHEWYKLCVSGVWRNRARLALDGWGAGKAFWAKGTVGTFFQEQRAY